MTREEDKRFNAAVTGYDGEYFMRSVDGCVCLLFPRWRRLRTVTTFMSPLTPAVRYGEAHERAVQRAIQAGVVADDYVCMSCSNGSATGRARRPMTCIDVLKAPASRIACATPDDHRRAWPAKLVRTRKIQNCLYANPFLWCTGAEYQLATRIMCLQRDLNCPPRYLRRMLFRATTVSL